MVTKPFSSGRSSLHSTSRRCTKEVRTWAAEGLAVEGELRFRKDPVHTLVRRGGEAAQSGDRPSPDSRGWSMNPK